MITKRYAQCNQLCSILITVECCALQNADPDVRTDLETFLSKVAVPEVRMPIGVLLDVASSKVVACCKCMRLHLHCAWWACWDSQAPGKQHACAMDSSQTQGADCRPCAWLPCDKDGHYAMQPTVLGRLTTLHPYL